MTETRHRLPHHLLAPSTHPHPFQPIRPICSSHIAFAPNGPQHEIHHHRRNQRARKHRRPPAIVEAAKAAAHLGPPSLPDSVGTPVEDAERVDHSRHGDGGEEEGADLADAIAEVEQSDREAAKQDGEVEPAEESALVGEEDFGLEARRKGNAFACVLGQRRPGVAHVQRECLPGAPWRRGWEDMMRRCASKSDLGIMSSSHRSGGRHNSQIQNADYVRQKHVRELSAKGADTLAPHGTTIGVIPFAAGRCPMSLTHAMRGDLSARTLRHPSYGTYLMVPMLYSAALLPL